MPKVQERMAVEVAQFSNFPARMLRSFRAAVEDWDEVCSALGAWEAQHLTKDCAEAELEQHHGSVTELLYSKLKEHGLDREIGSNILRLLLLRIELREKFIRRQSRDLARRIIGFVSRDDCADTSFPFRRKILNRILEIREARRKGGLDFHIGHGRNANQQLQIAEQGQR